MNADVTWLSAPTHGGFWYIRNPRGEGYDIAEITFFVDDPAHGFGVTWIGTRAPEVGSALIARGLEFCPVALPGAVEAMREAAANVIDEHADRAEWSKPRFALEAAAVDVRALPVPT